MRAEIDLKKCDSTGRCVMICPEVFQFHTGHKRAMVVKNPIPPEYAQAVLKAVEECPQNAITVTNS